MTRGHGRPGGRPPAGRPPRTALAGLAALVVGAGLLAGCAPSGAAGAAAPVGGGGGTDAGDRTYGSLPSWLPTSTVPVGRVVTASSTHPAVGIEGDTMRVDLPAGRVTVTAVGPAVPEEGRFPIPASTRCTFTVTMTGATAPIAVRAGQWTSIDERNVLHRLRLAPPATGTAAGPAVPASVGPGRTVTFDLVADLPPGSGALMWSPTAGRTVGTWDFDVEID